jgi:flagellar L-ring protein precursor FlgH
MWTRLSAAILSIPFLVPAQAEGLYQPGQFQALTSDRRAYRPGDILTVQIIEQSSAQSTADTKTEKNGAVNMALKTPSLDKSASVNLSDQFSGGGSINRTGRLLAQVSAVVQAVYPNGLLHVKGEQVIELNSEKQEIRLEGNVRPIDIADNNTVLSTRLADAKISYIGDGVLGEKQRPGILTRFLTWLGIL